LGFILETSLFFKDDTQYYNITRYKVSCCILFIDVLSVIMLNVIWA